MNQGDGLRWRCRRGMRELDILLTRFLDRHYQTASAAEQAAFRRLLETPDPELFAWLMGRAVAPDEDARTLVDRIRTGN